MTFITLGVLRAVALPALLAKKTALSLWTTGGFLVALAVDPTTLATAIVTVLTAATASVVIIIGALSKAKKELLEAQALVASNVKIVAGHVDGMQRAAEAKRTADDDTIIELRRQISEMKKTAELLAQAKSTTDAVAASQTPIK